MRNTLLLLFALLASHVWAAADDVRVMTFNVRYGKAPDGENRWELRRELLADTIKSFDPDLLGTQETLDFQRDFLVQKLTNYAAWGVGRDDGGEAGEMALLLYRKSRYERIDGGHFWLSETPEKAGSKSWDSSLPRIVSWVKLRDLSRSDAPPLLFLNTHFDHRGERARAEAARLIRRRLTELGAGAQIVLTGDFNADQGAEPYQLLFAVQDGVSGPLADAFRMLHPVPRADEGTFNGFRADSTTGPRIDWIGVSRHWKVIDAHIDHTVRDGHTPSDHFPVCVTLQPAR